MQRAGLQWAYRLFEDPKRLWRRYLGLNTLYVVLFGLQRLRIRRPSTEGKPPTEELRYG